jgi:hypothetical protein
METSEAQAPVAAEILAGSGLTPRVAVDGDLEATVVIGMKRLASSTASPGHRATRRST